MTMAKRLTEAQAADGFAALGNLGRLRLLRLLVRAGDAGMTVGEAGRRIGMPPSTLAHHLAALVRAGLVRQVKQGREVICAADFRAIRGTAAYLSEACCAGFDTEEESSTSSAA